MAKKKRVEYDEALRDQARAALKASDMDRAADLYGRLLAPVDTADRSAKIAIDRRSFARVLVALGRAREAIEQLEIVSQAQPDNPDALAKLAKTYAQHGRHVEALTPLRRVVELKPADAAGWWALSQSALVAGEGAEAEAARSACLALDPEHESKKAVEKARNKTATPVSDTNAKNEARAAKAEAKAAARAATEDSKSAKVEVKAAQAAARAQARLQAKAAAKTKTKTAEADADAAAEIRGNAEVQTKAARAEARSQARVAAKTKARMANAGTEASAAAEIGNDVGALVAVPGPENTVTAGLDNLELLRQQVKSAAKAGDFALAVSIYDQIFAQIDRDDASLKVMSDRGAFATLLLEVGRDQDAIEQLQIIGSLKPHDAVVQARMVRFYGREGRQDLGIVHLRRIAEITPGVAAAHWNLARVAHAIGRIDEAQAAMEACLAIDPGHADAIAAQTDWKRADATDPDTAPLTGHASSPPGDGGEASALSREQSTALLLESGDATAIRNAAQAAAKASDFDQAVALFGRLLEGIDPEDASAKVLYDRKAYARLLDRVGSHAKAAAQLAMVASLRPDDPDSQGSAAQAYIRCGRSDLAMPYLRATVGLKPTVSGNYWLLAQGAHDAGLEDEAERALDAFLTMEPDHAEAKVAKLVWKTPLNLSLAPPTDAAFSSVSTFVRDRAATSAAPPDRYPTKSSGYKPLIAIGVGALSFLLLYLFVRVVLLGG